MSWIDELETEIADCERARRFVNENPENPAVVYDEFFSSIVTQVDRELGTVNSQLYNNQQGIIGSRRDEQTFNLLSQRTNVGSDMEIFPDTLQLMLISGDSKIILKVCLDKNSNFKLHRNGNAFRIEDIPRLLIEPIVRADFSLD